MRRTNRVRSEIVSLEGASRSGEARPCRPALGRLVGTGRDGEALVRIAGEAAPRAARSTIRLRPADLGREVTLLVEDSGEGPAPIITGLVSSPVEAGSGITGADTLHLDAEQLLLTAARKISLRCGDSVITLTRDGKILIKGANLLQTSSGLHRIKGAAVQIN